MVAWQEPIPPSVKYCGDTPKLRTDLIIWILLRGGTKIILISIIPHEGNHFNDTITQNASIVKFSFKSQTFVIRPWPMKEFLKAG